ncbi:MAG: hypothetical protein KDE27_03855, partial [Planctomycetes bacterium]|nr:hypothetical protein [Planctomycetota bacterium]
LLPRAERRSAPPNDAWLPLLAIEQGRTDLLAELRGHHAYAVIDRDTGALVHGRDRYGEKPLLAMFEADSERLVAFGSTIGALRALGMPPPAIGLLPEHLLRCGFASFLPRELAGGLVLCERPPGRGRPVRQPLPPVRERVVASVARCIDTTVPVGLFLSGGIDSGCIAAALRALDRAVPAFQFRAVGTDGRERAIAAAIADRCDLPFHAVDGGPEVLDALPALTRDAGLPLGDPSVLAVHAVASAAAAAGVRVMLGGEGADELFFGYRRYRALARLPRLPRLARMAPRWSMSAAARWWRAATAADPIAELLMVTPPAFVATVLSRDAFVSLGRRPAPVTLRGLALADAARARDLREYLPLDLLPKVDVATLAAGVEARCPFLEGDPDPDASAAADLGKRRLRAAFASELPAAVFRQQKRGFALPLDAWFRGELDWLDLLRDERTLSRPHLRRTGVTQALDRHRRGRANLGHGLYALVAFELFLRDQERNRPDGPPGRRLSAPGGDAPQSAGGDTVPVG